MASPDHSGGAPVSLIGRDIKDCDVSELLARLLKVRDFISLDGTDKGSNDGSRDVHSSQVEDQSIHNQTKKLKNDLNDIICSLNQLKDNDEARRLIQNLLSHFPSESLQPSTDRKLLHNLSEIAETVSQLKLQIPSNDKHCRISKLLVILGQVRHSLPEIKTENTRNDGNGAIWQQSDQSIWNHTEKLKNEVDYITNSLKNLETFEDKASHLGNLIDRLSRTLPPPSSVLSSKKLTGKLRAINKYVLELKLRIPLPYTLSSKDAHQQARGGDGSDKTEGADELPDLHFHSKLLESATFEDFRVVYKSLELKTRMCLLCFAAITENEIVRKSFMIKWWISEGLLSEDEADAEGKYEEADRIFKELVKKDCIEPVNEEGRFVVNRYIMNPFVRSAVIELAKEANFFDFDVEKGYPTAICSDSYRACIFDGFYLKLVKKISALKRISELLGTLSSGSGERGCKLVKRDFSGACIVSRFGKRPPKDSGKRDSALVQRLREIEIKPDLVNKLLEEVMYPATSDSTTSEELGKGNSAFFERLQEIKMEPLVERLVQRLQDIKKEAKLGERLLEIDSELFKILPKDSRIGDSEFVKSLAEEISLDDKLVKRLQEIGIDSELAKLLQEIHPKLGGNSSEEPGKIDCALVYKFCKDSQKRNSGLLKRSIEIGIYSELVRRVQETINENENIKRLLKVKIRALLVERLLKMERDGELTIGFFQEFAKRLPKFKGISELVVDTHSSESRENGSDSVCEYSEELKRIGAQLVTGSSKEFGEIDTESVFGSSKELVEIGPEWIIGSSKMFGEIGAELSSRFSKGLGKRSSKKFHEELQKLCKKLREELFQQLGQVGVGLVYGSSEGLEKGSTEKNKTPFKEFDPEKVQTIFNVNEPYPDFFHPEWFSKLKTIKVLYLGRWQTSDKHHIEMENIEFLKGLENMKLLKFFSLQGVSRITKLPNSICKLRSLSFLDIRACNNLEELPEKIGLLEELTYLDISECYLLNVMPKTIKSLSKLQVFKGFVINSNAKSCTLEDLSKLEKLRKLGIYTNMREFPTNDDVKKFSNFKELQKLTISWGPVADKDARDQKKGRCTRLWKPARNEQGNTGETPIKKLQKLDLKCYPKKETPSLLLPRNLPELKKLYIRGGELQSLYPPREDREWKNVEVLRLKFLNNLKMDWTEVKSSFPRLAYVEKFKCPELTFFPSNENGVWLNEISDYQRCSSQVDLRLSRS